MFGKKKKTKVAVGAFKQEYPAVRKSLLSLRQEIGNLDDRFAELMKMVANNVSAEALVRFEAKLYELPSSKDAAELIEMWTDTMIAVFSKKELDDLCFGASTRIQYLPLDGSGLPDLSKKRNAFFLKVWRKLRLHVGYEVIVLMPEEDFHCDCSCCW